MKHRTLSIVAYVLNVLAWTILLFGFIASIIVAIKAATPVAQIVFLLGGFILTALHSALLLGASKLIYLFISIEEHLDNISKKL